MKRSIKPFFRSESGTITIYTAFAMTAFIGMAGLAIDGGLWYATERTMQSAADAAAAAGAVELLRGSSTSEVVAAAEGNATVNGFTTGNGITVTINHPPASGAYAGDSSAVEAIIQQPEVAIFSAILGQGDVSIVTRAVARVTTTQNCVYALDPSANGALYVAGGTDVYLDCGAVANSSSATAIASGSSTGCLTAESIVTAGDYAGSCFSPAPQINQSAVDDPLASLAAPGYSGCDETSTVSLSSGVTTTLYPGVYCGGIVLQGADVDFEPGLYVVAGVGLKITGNAIVTGDEVTFYFPGTVAESVVVHVAGDAQLTLAAPTAGTYDGVLFFGDRALPASSTAQFTGGADMELGGVVYFPSLAVDFAGNSQAMGSSWTTLIANTISFGGASYLSSPNAAVAGMPMGITAATLVE